MGLVGPLYIFNSFCAVIEFRRQNLMFTDVIILKHRTERINCPETRCNLINAVDISLIIRQHNIVLHQYIQICNDFIGCFYCLFATYSIKCIQNSISIYVMKCNTMQCNVKYCNATQCHAMEGNVM